MKYYTLSYTNIILSHTISKYTINHIKSYQIISSYIIKWIRVIEKEKEKEKKSQKAKAIDWEREIEIKIRK